jgi:hypothetical protein
MNEIEFQKSLKYNFDPLGFSHRCNFFCNPSQDIHRDIVFALEDLTFEQVKIAQERLDECSVLDVELAREAPEYAPDGRGPYPYRYLVTIKWKTKNEILR